MLRRAGALGLAVFLFGVAFGVLAVGTGLSPLMACALSVLVCAGGSQFAAVGVVAAGGSPWAGVASGLLLNARFVAFGLAVAPLLRGGIFRRALKAQILIDETSAMALAEPDPGRADRTFWLTGLVLVPAWVAGTAFGALAGGRIGDPAAWGLDAAFPAGFLALLVPLLRDGATRASAVAGVAIAVVLLPLVPPGIPVLASAAGVTAGLWWRRRTDARARQAGRGAAGKLEREGGS